jgi:hypothetical protein
VPNAALSFTRADIAVWYEALSLSPETILAGTPG